MVGLLIRNRLQFGTKTQHRLAIVDKRARVLIVGKRLSLSFSVLSVHSVDVTHFTLFIYQSQQAGHQCFWRSQPAEFAMCQLYLFIYERSTESWGAAVLSLIRLVVLSTENAKSTAWPN